MVIGVCFLLELVIKNKQKQGGRVLLRGHFPCQPMPNQLGTFRKVKKQPSPNKIPPNQKTILLLGDASHLQKDNNWSLAEESRLTSSVLPGSVGRKLADINMIYYSLTQQDS